MRHARVAVAALGLAVLGCGAGPAPAEPLRPLVVELFTSQGCSSCPPADAFLVDLARDRPDVLPLAFHITYWDNLGWRDPFALPDATARQQHYANALPRHVAYTPQMVVEGRYDIVGSDRASALTALREAAILARNAAPVTVTRAANGTAVTIGAGSGDGAILLIGFDHLHQTPVRRGENSGRTLTEANIVRSVTVLGRWTGAPVALQSGPQTGEDEAVIVQASDGRILGAARITAPAS